MIHRLFPVAATGSFIFIFSLFSPLHAQVQPETVNLFRTNCSLCHATNGSGSDIGKTLGVLDLRSAKVQTQTDAQLIGAVTNGKAQMPPNKGKLTATQIKQLVAYVRTFANKK